MKTETLQSILQKRDDNYKDLTLVNPVAKISSLPENLQNQDFEDEDLCELLEYMVLDFLLMLSKEEDELIINGSRSSVLCYKPFAENHKGDIVNIGVNETYLMQKLGILAQNVNILQYSDWVKNRCNIYIRTYLADIALFSRELIHNVLIRLHKKELIDIDLNAYYKQDSHEFAETITFSASDGLDTITHSFEILWSKDLARKKEYEKQLEEGKKFDTWKVITGEEKNNLPISCFGEPSPEYLKEMHIKSIVKLDSVNIDTKKVHEYLQKELGENNQIYTLDSLTLVNYLTNTMLCSKKESEFRSSEQLDAYKKAIDDVSRVFLILEMERQEKELRKREKESKAERKKLKEEKKRLSEEAKLGK